MVIQYTVYICFVFSHVLIWTPKKKTSHDLVAIPYLKSWSVGACFDQHGTNKPINIGGHTKMKRTSSFLDSVDFLKHKLLESGNCFLFWKKWMLESQVRDYLCDDRPVITNAYLRKNAFHTLKVQKLLWNKTGIFINVRRILEQAMWTRYRCWGSETWSVGNSIFQAVKSFAIKNAAPILFQTSGVMVQGETSCAVHSRLKFRSKI